MPRYMISFNRGEPIALALDKEGKTRFTIYVTEDNGGDPDINVDSPNDLITDLDISTLRGSMKLGRLELKMIKKALATPEDKRSKLHISEKILRAIEILEEMAIDKLKTEVDFTSDPEVDKIVPLIGVKDFDRSIAMIGASGSGKSFLACEICKHDRRKRPVVLFTKVDDDESLRPLKSLRTPADKKSRLIKIPLHTEDQLLNLPSNTDLKNCIVLFDDIGTFAPDIAQYLVEYQANLLETGRHDGITCISTTHILNNYHKTRTMLNEAELVILFPASNKNSSIQYLRLRHGMIREDATRMINKAMNDGRMMCVKQSAPNLIMTEKAVILL